MLTDGGHAHERSTDFFLFHLFLAQILIYILPAFYPYRANFLLLSFFTLKEFENVQSKIDEKKQRL